MWLKVILSGAALLRALIDMLKQRQLLTLQEQADAAIALRQLVADIERNAAVREEARSRNAAVPADRSLPDDGFRRD